MPLDDPEITRLVSMFAESVMASSALAAHKNHKLEKRVEEHRFTKEEFRVGCSNNHSVQ